MFRTIALSCFAKIILAQTNLTSGSMNNTVNLRNITLADPNLQTNDLANSQASQNTLENSNTNEPISVTVTNLSSIQSNSNVISNPVPVFISNPIRVGDTIPGSNYGAYNTQIGSNSRLRQRSRRDEKTKITRI